jgi:hypothetical protein
MKCAGFLAITKTIPGLLPLLIAAIGVILSTT